VAEFARTKVATPSVFFPLSFSLLLANVTRADTAAIRTKQCLCPAFHKLLELE